MNKYVLQSQCACISKISRHLTGLLISLEPLSLRGVCPLIARTADWVQARRTRILFNFTVKEAQQVKQQVRLRTSFTGL